LAKFTALKGFSDPPEELSFEKIQMSQLIMTLRWISPKRANEIIPGYEISRHSTTEML